MGSLANLDLRMMHSNLLILLLVNLAFAATFNNAPEEETRKVHRRGSSGDASAKRTQFMEEGGDDSACVRRKMRDWRQARKAGEASLDRRARQHMPSSSEVEETRKVHRRGSSGDASAKRTQFMEECGDDSACVRRKMRDWRQARKAGEASLDRRARQHMPSSSEVEETRKVHRRGSSG